MRNGYRLEGAAMDKDGGEAAVGTTGKQRLGKCRCWFIHVALVTSA
jgi:hypothetical protein